jgi:L-aspartate oxidase
VRIQAALVLLATGGLGQAYRHTTNPDIATGDGIAMAYRAGVAVANLEFVQFHPTALYPARERAFLISEAVRGEGAVLRRKDGSLLMESVHQLASLAPRDVVARTIDLELKATGADYVLLDLSPIEGSYIEKRFPGITAECRERGFDILKEPLPVVPAAHYSCGGVVTDTDGRTTLPGLYAAGEVACTGVHGANRLASNSLLEAVVYSHRASLHVPYELARADDLVSEAAVEPETQRRFATGDPQDDTTEAVETLRGRVRDLMWEYAGIARSDERLDDAAQRLDTLWSEARPLVGGSAGTSAIELRNLLEVCSLIVTCARLRRESRGLHFNVDHPHRDNERQLRDTVLRRGQQLP